MDKCYKLHEYPPEYKSKNRVAAIQNHDDAPDQISFIDNDLSNMFKGFSQERCQQVMSALSTHMITVNPHEETTTGKCYSLSINSGKNHTNGYWIQVLLNMFVTKLQCFLTLEEFIISQLHCLTKLLFELPLLEILT